METNQQNEVEYSGIVEQSGEIITFVISGFCFDFMTKPYDSFDYHKNEVTLEPDEHGFITGKLHNGCGIAIYIGHKLSILGRCTFTTWCYIIIEDYADIPQLNCIERIRFTGGTVNTLYPPKSLFFDSKSLTDKPFSVEYTPDKTVFDLNTTQLNGSLEFDAIIKTGFTANKGFFLMNDGSRMDWHFNQAINIGSIEKAYNSIISVFRFLTFRENVGFESIALLKKDDSLPENDCYSKFAVCHIQDTKSFTKRPYQRCIDFRMLDSSVLSNLFATIMRDAERKASFCINFLPKSDNEYLFVDNEKIRATISAIECELELAKISLPKTEKLEALKKQVINIVKRSQDNTELNEKSYSVILGSIDHWGDSLSDRIYELYLRHKDEMDVFLKDLPGYVFSEKEIGNLVIYRNDITHGKYRVNTEDIAAATLCLMALVYCCILTRIGMEKSQIIDIMKSGAFLYN